MKVADSERDLGAEGGLNWPVPGIAESPVHTPAHLRGASLNSSMSQQQGKTTVRFDAVEQQNSVMPPMGDEQAIVSLAEFSERYGIPADLRHIFVDEVGSDNVERNHFLARLSWSEQFRCLMEQEAESERRRKHSPLRSFFGLGSDGSGGSTASFLWWWDVAVLCSSFALYVTTIYNDFALFNAGAGGKRRHAWMFYDDGVGSFASAVCIYTVFGGVLALDCLSARRKLGLGRVTQVYRGGYLCNPFKILKNRRCVKWMVIDVIPAIPLDFILTLLAKAAGEPEGGFAHAAILAANLRLLALGKIFYSMSTNQIRVSGPKARVPKRYYIFLFEAATLIKGTYWWLVITHLVACMRSAMRQYDGKPDDYMEGLYWTVITLCAVGYSDSPDTSDMDKVLACCTFVIGLIINSFFVGVLTVTMQRGNARLLRAEHMLLTLSACGSSEMPDFLLEQILALQLFSMESEYGSIFSDVASKMPDEVSATIDLIVKQRHLASIPVFADLTYPCQLLLASTMKTVTCTAQHTMIVNGNKMDAVYFLACGYAVQVKGVLQSDGDELKEASEATEGLRGSQASEVTPNQGGGAFPGFNSFNRSNQSKGSVTDLATSDQGSGPASPQSANRAPAAEKNLRYLKAGASFGVESLLTETPYSVKTLTCCVFYKVELTSLQNVVHMFPCFAGEMLRDGMSGSTLGELAAESVMPVYILEEYINPRYGANVVNEVSEPFEDALRPESLCDDAPLVSSGRPSSQAHDGQARVSSDGAAAPVGFAAAAGGSGYSRERRMSSRPRLLEGKTTSRLSKDSHSDFGPRRRSLQVDYGAMKAAPGDPQLRAFSIRAVQACRSLMFHPEA